MREIFNRGVKREKTCNRFLERENMKSVLRAGKHVTSQVSDAKKTVAEALSYVNQSITTRFDFAAIGAAVP